VSDKRLVIVNKRYSSWSLRAWLMLRMANLPFEEIWLDLAEPESKQTILRYNPAGKVPVLLDGDLTVYDSLAIGEYVNEVYAGGRFLPTDQEARAIARSACAEMHAGFPNLRQALPMDLGREPSPVDGLSPETNLEIARVLSLWDGLRQRYGDDGEFLFGAWGLPDAMFTPVAARLHHYGVGMDQLPRAKAYCDALRSLPAYQEWLDAAMEEPERPQFSREGYNR